MSKLRPEIEFLSLCPNRQLIDVHQLLESATQVMVPVTLNEGAKAAMYLEGGGPIMTCRIFLDEDEALEYLDIVSEHTELEDLDLKYCPLTVTKLIASLAVVSKKAGKPVQCMLMSRHKEIFYEAGILWTNHEPYML